MTSHRIAGAGIQFRRGESVIAPLRIFGLPETVSVLGREWRRKVEFHLTVAAADVLESAGRAADRWERIQVAIAASSLGPVDVGPEIRRVSHPEEEGLETLIVMARAPGLERIYHELSGALDVQLAPPPAHITLYSTDPARGIGIRNERELAERAPALSEAAQEQVRAAMGFARVVLDGGAMPPTAAGDRVIALGATDAVFTPRVMQALAYAAHVHAGQLRKGTASPYLAHLLSVAALVAEDGGGEIEVMGAILHDAAEDHGGERRLADIARRFGPGVAAIVRGLSDWLGEAGEEKEPWRVRKERYLSHLRDVEDGGILRVSNADKLHNARAVLGDLRQYGAVVWGRFRAGREEQLWYYRELASIFAERRPGSSLALELGVVVAQLHEAARALDPAARRN